MSKLQDPKPSSLNPKPSAFEILNPNPCTLNPTRSKHNSPNLLIEPSEPHEESKASGRHPLPAGAAAAAVAAMEAINGGEVGEEPGSAFHYSEVFV